LIILGLGSKSALCTDLIFDVMLNPDALEVAALLRFAAFQKFGLRRSASRHAIS
jgi:hypothetical protein